MQTLLLNLIAGAVAISSIASVAKAVAPTTSPAMTTIEEQTAEVSSSIQALRRSLLDLKRESDRIAAVATVVSAAVARDPKATPVRESHGALKIVWLLLPFSPFALGAWFFRSYKLAMKTEMPNSIQDPDTHRSASLGLAGFAVTVFAGLVLLEKQSDISLSLAIYFSGVSFAMLLASNALQFSKKYHWIDVLADCCMQSGVLALAASVIALLISRAEDPIFSCVIALLLVAAIAWELVVRFRTCSNIYESLNK